MWKIDFPDMKPFLRILLPAAECGLLLGAFFMATDYVTSPTTTKGKLVFGIGLGVITCAIRFLGRMNEGVSFAILLMNLVVPYIEVLTRQDRLGIAKVKKSKEGAAK